MKHFFTAVVISIIAVNCGRRTSPPAGVIATSRPFDRAHWMENHLDVLGERPLRQLTLPASHDAAMYLSGFPQSLGRTQNLSIYAQLVKGVRYFDLRPKWHSDQIYLHHDMIVGPTLATVLGDVRQFLNEDHRELIILKFSHFDSISSERYAVMTHQITDRLASWLFKSISPGKRLADIPVGKFLQGHGTVLIVCDGAFPVKFPVPGIWVYRDWDSADPAVGDLRVYDQYSNSMSYPAMKADQFGKFNRYNGRCRTRPDLPCDLFLLSWTLTPPTNVPAFAKEPNEHLAADLAALKMPNRFGCVVNLLYMDCVETSGATELSIQMNESSTTK